MRIADVSAFYTPVGGGVRTYVDAKLREFTMGEPHDVTDRIFVVRRAYRVNDWLPDDPKSVPKWRWQRSGWLLVDRQTALAREYQRVLNPVVVVLAREKSNGEEVEKLERRLEQRSIQRRRFERSRNRRGPTNSHAHRRHVSGGRHRLRHQQCHGRASRQIRER